ncbi:MAG: FAD-dependent oxidoreductase [Planctomycetota bacterium]
MLQELPVSIFERVRTLQHGDHQGDLVVYWMRNAIRIDENPALEVAKYLAVKIGKPLLIYHAISEHYEYASDRHHTFILEGARDVQKSCESIGLRYCFHVATPDDRRTHLVDLANAAAAVVTEEMPVDPARRFLDRLVEQTDTAIHSVDTACVVPMQLVGKPYTRAFKYRDATKRLYEERVSAGWIGVDAKPALYSGKLAWESIDLQQADLAELVARCDIDHSVPPIPHTQGGSVAGYKRWERFKANGLLKYAKLRNNALIDGVSRMSAYLHYGMVSPFRLAREAADFDHSSAEKYLDELLIWRELAYAFCHYRPDHDSWEALPNWARQSLEFHQSDSRDVTYSWEELARGATEDRLWNAAQKSLLVNGELHNNVRMTWGKAILNWTDCPKKALQFIFDLNHRYALDGRDPASFGGILWCLGQFDRPFEPEKKIFGTVRPRSTKDHARRLDPEKYFAKVAVPRFETTPKVAVIGAGLSGMIAARTLSDQCIDVTVFEKSRGPGGRMSTRRVDGQSKFDHGAQYFTVTDDCFQRYVDSWQEQGLVGLWPNHQKIVVLQNGQIEKESSPKTRYVGVPKMNSICKHLGNGLKIETQTRIQTIECDEMKIGLISDDGRAFEGFDRLIVSAPAGQTAELLEGFSGLAEEAGQVEMQRCWALMVSFDLFEKLDWVGAFVHDSPIAWIARNDTKPGRPRGTFDFVAHTHHDFAVQHWDEDPDKVAQLILEAFWAALGVDSMPPAFINAHRWKFARSAKPGSKINTFDSSKGIAVCGDWTQGDRVEGAFLSGMNAAGRIMGSLRSFFGSETAEPAIQQKLF